MNQATFEKEKYLQGPGPVFVIGIDEAGRGPLAGPVVAAAVLYKDSQFTVPEEREKEFALIRDSKKLSSAQREKAFALVQEFFHVGIGIIGPDVIDRLNILQATFLAMKTALSELERVATLRGKENQILLVDGNQRIPNLSLPQEAVVSGDSLVRSIAAASIIAKVTRDRLIVEADALYPEYGFANHKGYGTKEHMEALRKHGPCPIHRMSFRPVELSIPENVNERFFRDLRPGKRRSLAKNRSI